ncbi:hypothetical protein QPK87_13350 [Kamptonema cortianum]|nr:hypothetical protein [Geitlerinema splendidum]MDK3157554.1 hypothetical protein [Kamptonema cortianum]
MYKTFLWVVIGCVAMGGCGVRSETKIDLPAEHGAADSMYQSVASSDGSLSLDVPKEWTIVAKDNPVLAEAVKALEQEMPSLKNHVEFALSNNMMKLMAMEMRAEEVKKHQFAENVNVIVIKGAPDPMPDDEWEKTAEATAGALDKSGAMKWEVVDLPAGKAAHYYGTLQLEKATNDLAGYILVKDGVSYTVTFSCAQGQIADRKPEYDKMMQTFRIKG